MLAYKLDNAAGYWNHKRFVPNRSAKPLSRFPTDHMTNYHKLAASGYI